MTIYENYRKIRELIEKAENISHRKSHSVELLAVSKKQSIAKIEEALNLGQRSFGENYLQEALEKIDYFKNKDIEWHFIGKIQSNKTRKIAELFSWVHSLDSIKIAERLNAQRPAHLSPLNICIEVNISHEKTKAGIDEDHIFALAKYCSALPRLKLRGLMTIPALQTDFDQQRIPFHQLAIIFAKLNENGFSLDTLSMGTSIDFAAAIAEGATIIRLGTLFFGERSP